jgi:hypothetical protein
MSNPRTQFHIDKAQALVRALAARISMETLGGAVSAETLLTTLRCVKNELLLASLSLTEPKPPLRRDSTPASIALHDKGNGYGR